MSDLRIGDFIVDLEFNRTIIVKEISQAGVIVQESMGDMFVPFQWARESFESGEWRIVRLCFPLLVFNT